MAKVSVLYTCGCGFKSVESGKAEDHCDEKGHSITVIGTIQPLEKKPKLNRSRRQPTHQQAPILPAQQEAKVELARLENEYNALRAKLRPK